MGYVQLACYALSKGDVCEGSHYIHLFVVLASNLFARSISLVLMLSYFAWVNDCLTGVIPKDKSDPSGVNVAQKHLYANPYFPAICPILALGVYMFSQSEHVPKPFQSECKTVMCSKEMVGMSFVAELHVAFQCIARDLGVFLLTSFRDLFIRNSGHNTILNNYYPNHFQDCMPYFLASVVYHLDWIEANLPPSHALF